MKTQAHAAAILSKTSVDVTPKQMMTVAVVALWSARLAVFMLASGLRGARGATWLTNASSNAAAQPGPPTRARKPPSSPSPSRATTIALLLVKSVCIFVACAPLYDLLGNDLYHIHATYCVGVVMQLGAICVETLADEQLEAFRTDMTRSRAVLDTGLWGWSRNPNYVAEMVFWAGLYVSSGLELGPSLAGPVFVWFLFRVVLAPRMESHLASGERRDAYRAYSARVRRRF